MTRSSIECARDVHKLVVNAMQNESRPGVYRTSDQHIIGKNSRHVILFITHSGSTKDLVWHLNIVFKSRKKIVNTASMVCKKGPALEASKNIEEIFAKEYNLLGVIKHILTKLVYERPS